MPRTLKPCRRKKTVSFRKLIAPLRTMEWDDIIGKTAKRSFKEDELIES